MQKRIHPKREKYFINSALLSLLLSQNVHTIIRQIQLHNETKKLLVKSQLKQATVFSKAQILQAED